MVTLFSASFNKPEDKVLAYIFGGMYITYSEFVYEAGQAFFTGHYQWDQALCDIIGVGAAVTRLERESISKGIKNLYSSLPLIK